jgi:hypothetical protein
MYVCIYVYTCIDICCKRLRAHAQFLLQSPSLRVARPRFLGCVSRPRVCYWSCGDSALGQETAERLQPKEYSIVKGREWNGEEIILSIQMKR